MYRTGHNFKKILIIGGILLLISIFFYADSIGNTPYNHLEINTNTGMTLKERKDDFKDICNFIRKNVPFIKEYKELYGIGYDELTEYYTNIVKNTSNDFEYYAAVSSFLNNIPSGHMRIGFPDSGLIPEMYKFNTNDYPEFDSVCLYWEEQLRKKNLNNADIAVTQYSFEYINGEYYTDSYEVHKNESEFLSSKLISIDGVPIDEFIKICPLYEKLKYDHVISKPYRDRIILNDKFGTECNAELLLSDGTYVNEVLYYGMSGILEYSYAEYFKTQTKNDDEDIDVLQDEDQGNIDYKIDEQFLEGLYYYNCTENNYIYIMFNDFSEGGYSCVDLLKNKTIPDNVIIDLRHNTGGYEFVGDEIISQLTVNDIDVKAALYKPDIFYGIYCGYDLKLLSGNIVYEELDQRIITAEGDKQYNIYVLVSGESLSAADQFVNIVKNNGLGVIIGENNTGGEAYGSPDLKLMEKSGLYFYYTDIKWNNTDGTDNSVYGTSPDYYTPFDKEASDKCKKLFNNGQSVIKHENRLKWGDDALIEAIKLIKEREAAQ